MRAKAESCLRLFIGSGLLWAPANPDARRANALLCAPPKWGPKAPTTPMGRALRPSTPGDFPVAGKVTKGAPRAAPFGIPRCVVAALFALAALRSVSRRATFCHKNRPICHFELSGQIGLIFSFGSIKGTLPAVNPWHGRVVPEDARWFNLSRTITRYKSQDYRGEVPQKSASWASKSS